MYAPRGARKRDLKPIDQMNEGQLLQAARITAGLTQSEVISAVGMPKPTYSSWENSEIIRDKIKLGLVVEIIRNIAKKDDENKYLDTLEAICQDKFVHRIDPNGNIKRYDKRKVLLPRYIMEIAAEMPNNKQIEIFYYMLKQYEIVLQDKQEWLTDYLSKPSAEKEKLHDEYLKVIEWLSDYNHFMSTYDRSVLESE